MIWRRKRYMCGSTTEQSQRVLSAVVLPHVERIENLGPVSILSRTFQGQSTQLFAFSGAAIASSVSSNF